MDANDVRFDASPYRRDHGALPRGQGSWAFCPSDKYDRPDYLGFVFWRAGLFGAAKAEAARYFRRLGVRNVVVCP